MSNNPFTALPGQGRTPVLTHVSIGSSLVAEHLAHAGYDALIVDLQHGDIDLREATRMLQAISTTAVVPMVRVPGIDHGIIAKVLDSGSRGVMCPVMETAADCADFIAATRYPPLGSRSYGPLRPGLYPGADFGDEANAAVTTIVQIETALGVENAEDILSTPGLDAVYIGPTDLSRSYGDGFAADFDSGPVYEAIKRVAKIARSNGVLMGLFCADAGYARRMASDGLVDFLGVGTDIGLLGAAARLSLAEVRGAF
ncbi:HpcH/HpaI aldolase/citrate lyase family protein [Arthrobacter sp. AZCC_0090]|uniref:HpcH/HpaI aldolase family protein n=1 Tax=Arthrobacter sp. AZCC_0090 TaxID=2735881 RepID=UPI001621481E|nr:aldolase/citrate lyase family protein [Arthrobacter sp. AZCC_0090]MBB6405249.1 4-hydroxy-2-oxoheptanedioate aldolase [Arthrobacter sp. AZCC_0090]